MSTSDGKCSRLCSKHDLCCTVRMMSDDQAEFLRKQGKPPKDRNFVHHHVCPEGEGHVFE